MLFRSPESFRTSSFNIFEKENPILRKVTENGFNVWSFLDFSSQPLYHIFLLIEWYPELLNKISDEDFIVIINESRVRSNFTKQYFEMLYRYKPNVIWHFFEEKPYIFTYEQREFLIEKKKELYEQNQAPIQETEQPEDPTTASVKSMVKIARILDYKKKYKLADKFTNILRKYNV